MMNRPPLDAIVFDYDGVLADTHGLWDQAYAALFARYGAQPAPADRRRLATLGTTALGHALAELLGGIAPPGLLADEITSLVTCNLGRPVSPMPGAVPLVTALAGKTPLGVASNSPGKIVRSHLSQIGLADRFQAVVGIDDVPAPKPAPDPYRTACALLGKRPQACTAIEDSQQGISSATTAGLYVIGIQTSGDSLEADAVYSSLTDPGLWQVLLESRTFRTAGLPPPASGGTRTRRRAGSVSGGVRVRSLPAAPGPGAR